MTVPESEETRVTGAEVEARRELREGESYLYAVTTDVDCEWCSAKVDEDCHLQGVIRFSGDRRQHTCRIDPTSNPIGILHPHNPAFSMTSYELFDA